MAIEVSIVSCDWTAPRPKFRKRLRDRLIRHDPLRQCGFRIVKWEVI